MTRDEVPEIERRVNEVIQSDLKVTEEFIVRADAEKEFNLGKLPEDAGERIRIIRIGDYDACALPHKKGNRKELQKKLPACLGQVAS